MVSKYTAFHTYMTSQGTSIKDANKSTTIRMLNDSFVDNPFYQSLPINGTNVDCIVEKMENYFNKKLLFKSTNTNEIGELVTLDNLYWLIIDYQNNGVMPKAIIHQCNHQLKWLNSNGDIKSAYGVVSNKSDIDAIDEKRYINLPSGELKMTIANNADTLLIIRDKRFIINGSAWRCNFNDYTTKPGLCVLNLVEDVINDNDNLILGIADYYNQHSYALSVLNGDITLVKGSTAQINCVLTDNDIVVTNPTLIYTSDDTDCCIVSNTGLITALEIGTTTIDVSYGEVNSIINITVQEVPVADNYTLKIKGDNTIKINQSKNYIVQMYNNGVLIDELPCTWNINNTNCTITSSDDSSCIIKAGSIGGLSSILSVTLDNSPLVTASQTISITGLW